MKYPTVIFILLLLGVSNPVIADLKILFQSGRDGDTWSWYSLFIMDPDGSNPVNLSKAIGVNLGAVWSPDRTKVLYASGPDFEREILMMDLNGSDLLNLTNDPGSDNYPRWSPDGTRIVWNRWPPRGLDGEVEIFTMNADGSNPRNLGPGYRPKWSPDGTMIGFTDDNAFIINADGTGRHRVADDLPETEFISWSRDGTKIALRHHRPFGFIRDHLYVVNIDGTRLVELTKDLPEIKCAGVTWSPDDTKLAFHASVGFNWSNIYVVNSDGTNRVNLTGHHPPGFDHNPCWSPDGDDILFETNRDGNREIYLMDADGSNPVNLTNHPLNDQSPSWFRFDLPITSISPQEKLITTWGQMKHGNQ